MPSDLHQPTCLVGEGTLSVVSTKADAISNRSARATHSSEREVGGQAPECTEVGERQTEDRPETPKAGQKQTSNIRSWWPE